MAFLYAHLDAYKEEACLPFARTHRRGSAPADTVCLRFSEALGRDVSRVLSPQLSTLYAGRELPMQLNAASELSC